MEQFVNEIWKPCEVNPVYYVSNYGRVKTIDHKIWCKVNNSYSLRKGHLCKLTNNNSKKYWRVCVQINNKQKMFSVKPMTPFKSTNTCGWRKPMTR